MDLKDGVDPDPSALATVLLQLHHHVARAFPELDADDVVQSTLTQLLKRSDRLANTEIDNAQAYLLGATRNAALDVFRARKRRREVPLDEPAEHVASSDDAVAALIDRDATHTSVVAALRAGIQAGDALTVRIITTWLDIADELGRAPSTREVAASAGVSHTTVAQALKQFRALLGGRP